MEFKKLSDVEVVAEPAESANVLIEEDGVIKKAPKTAVGSADNFIVISVPLVQDADAASVDIIEGATCNKTYDEVIEMYCAGKIDCAIMKGIESSLGSLMFLIACEVALLNENGTVHISDASSAKCIGFTFANQDINLDIYYYRDGLSYTNPFPQPE